MRPFPLLLILTAGLAPAALIPITPGIAMDQPYGLGIGPDKALYYCEVGNDRISRLDLKTHQATVIADRLGEPYELAFDKSGNLFFCDRTNHNVRRIDRKTRAIT